jgi:hypothetical protein
MLPRQTKSTESGRTEGSAMAGRVRERYQGNLAAGWQDMAKNKQIAGTGLAWRTALWQAAHRSSHAGLTLTAVAKGERLCR